MTHNALYKLLKEDHREITSLCRRMHEVSSRAKKSRRRLLSRLTDLLQAHTHAEEQTLYDRLKAESTSEQPIHELVLEGFEEHHMADTLLGEINILDVTDERWAAKVEVLGEMLKHHIKEEEGEIWPKAHKILSNEDFQSLASQFAIRREAELQGPENFLKGEYSILASLDQNNNDEPAGPSLR